MIRRLYEYAKQKGVGAGGAEVVFSPQTWDASHLARVVQEIERAERSIDVAMYSYSDAKIGAALADAATRAG